jgi:hypothetical protein
MKPILEWYEDLPEPIRSQAIANYDGEYPVAASLHMSLRRGFYWQKYEGDEYWEEITDKAEAGEYTPPPTIEQALSDLTKTLEEMKEAIESVKKAIRNESTTN